MIRTENPYIYKPGNQIRKDLAESAQGIDAAANQIVERKKADYNQVKEVYDGMDLLKEQFNRHHSGLLNEEVAEIEKLTADSIKTMGRMDYSKLGKVNDRIRKLKQMQNNSVNAVKAFESMASRINANPDYVKNPIELLRQSEAIIGNKDVLRSPINLGKTLEDLYSSNVDYEKVVTDRLTKALPKGTTEEVNYINDNGDEITANIVTYKGVTFWNKDTNEIEQEQITLPDKSTIGALDAMTKDVLQSPQEAEGYEKYAIGADKAIGVSMQDSLYGVAAKIVSSGVTSTKRSMKAEVIEYNKIKTENAKAQGEILKLELGVAELKAENQPELYALEIKEKEAKIDSYKSTIRANNALAGSRIADADQTREQTSRFGTDPDGITESKDGSLRMELTDGVGNYVRVRKENGKVIVTSAYDGAEKALSGGEFDALVNNTSKEKRRALNGLKNIIKTETEKSRTGKEIFSGNSLSRENPTKEAPAATVSNGGLPPMSPSNKK
jgi:hypothetical protein